MRYKLTVVRKILNCEISRNYNLFFPWWKKIELQDVNSESRKKGQKCKIYC